MPIFHEVGMHPPYKPAKIVPVGGHVCGMRCAAVTFSLSEVQELMALMTHDVTRPDAVRFVQNCLTTVRPQYRSPESS